MAERKGINRDELFPTKHFMQQGYGDCQTLGGALDQILKSQGGVDYLQTLIQIQDGERGKQYTVTFPGRKEVIHNALDLYDHKLAQTEDLGVSVLEKAFLEVARREGRVPDPMKLFMGEDSPTYYISFNDSNENLKFSQSAAANALKANLQREVLAGNVMVSGNVHVEKDIEDMNGNRVHLPAPHRYAIYPKANGTFEVTNPHDNNKPFVLSQEQLAANFSGIFVGALPGKELNIDPNLKEVAAASAKYADSLQKVSDFSGAYSLGEDSSRTGNKKEDKPMTPEEAAAKEEYHVAHGELRAALDKADLEIGGPRVDPQVLTNTKTRIEDINTFRKTLEGASSNPLKESLCRERLAKLREDPQDTYAIYETCKAAKENLPASSATMILSNQLTRLGEKNINSTLSGIKNEAQIEAESIYNGKKPLAVATFFGLDDEYRKNVAEKKAELTNEKLLDAIGEKYEGIPNKESGVVLDSILSGHETGRAMEMTTVKSQGARINIAIESDKGRVTLTSNPNAEYKDGKVVGGYSSMVITDNKGRTQVITDPAIIEDTIGNRRIEVRDNSLSDATRDVPKFDSRNQVVSPLTQALVTNFEISKGYDADYRKDQIIIKPQSGGELAINFEPNSTKVTSITVKDANGVSQTIKDNHKIKTVLDDLKDLPNDQHNNNRSNDWVEERKHALQPKEAKVSQVSDLKDHPHVAEARERAQTNKTIVSTPEHNPAVGGNQPPNVAQSNGRERSNSVA